MESLPLDLAGLLAIAAGLGWAAGIRLYATLFVIGLAGWLQWVTLPAGLQVLEHPWVLTAAGVMLLIEFCADKVPLLDSLWDGVHAFLRVPAGAALAAAAFGGHGVEWQTAMAILGGTLAAGAHLAKAGSRLAVNLSPEPLSNVALSLGEESLVLLALWLMFAHPWLLLALLALFGLLLAWSLPKLFALFRAARQRGRQLLRR